MSVGDLGFVEKAMLGGGCVGRERGQDARAASKTLGEYRGFPGAVVRARMVHLAERKWGAKMAADLVMGRMGVGRAKRLADEVVEQMEEQMRVESL